MIPHAPTTYGELIRIDPDHGAAAETLHRIPLGASNAEGRHAPGAVPVPVATPRAHHHLPEAVDEPQIAHPLEHCHLATDGDLVGAGSRKRTFTTCCSDFRERYRSLR